MKLEAVLRDVAVADWEGTKKSRQVEVEALAYRSSEVKPGSLFCTWKGECADGHDFIPQAVDGGAVAVVGERRMPPMSCEYVRVESGRAALAVMSANFFSRPAEKLDMVGVTGTNGKTSTALLIRHFLEKSGRKTGLIGTVGYDSGEGMVSADRTTPEGLELQVYLDAMVRNRCGAAVMEVSSHALEQGRVEGIPYQVAVFTNLTQDHLDYHGTMENYFGAKLRLFAGLRAGQAAVLNADDPHSAPIARALAEGVQVLRYGISQRGEKADFSAKDISCTAKGTRFTLCSPEGEFEMQSKWLGSFSVENILAAVTAGFALGLSVKEMVRCGQPPVPGRMEVVPHGRNFLVVVDYAHTGDAVKKALEALRPLAEGKLKVLIGCGGNRDKTKRPLMARAACEAADGVMFTSDNPRDEEPLQILDDMIAGVPGRENFSVVPDRKEAIGKILAEANSGDVILIAGKGHEEVLEIKGKEYPFSDVKTVREFLQEVAA